MKKIWSKILCLVLVLGLALMGLIGCADGDWSGTVTLKNSGDVIENGGFVAQTENYVYFINGIEESTAQNKMGTPLKGALMVADKNDFSKSELVVPKLFVASDYDAGVFIDNGYVYYGTPSVEKNSSGDVAKNKLTFMRTKLDGSGQTDEFLTLNSISSNYRIVKTDAGVCIYYTLTDELKCYNTSTKTDVTIIKKDQTTSNDYTLNTLTMLSSAQNQYAVAFFTATVYTQDYNSSAAQSSNYSRPTADYNRVYMIKAGQSAPVMLASGIGNQASATDDVTYTINLVDDGYVFYSKSVSGVSKYYAIKLEDAVDSANWADSTKNVELNGKDYVASTNLFVSLDEVYVLGEKNVYKTTALAKDNLTKTPILKKDRVNKLLFLRVEGGQSFLYYINADNQIAKINVTDTTGEMQVIRVSRDKVTTTWFAPEIVKVGTDKEYLFYSDNSNQGKTYIECVDLGAEVKEETDEETEKTTYYLDTEKVIKVGKMTDVDRASVMEDKIDAMLNKLPEEGLGANADNDAEFKTEFEKTVAEYNNLSASIKEMISAEKKAVLTDVKKAFEVAKKYAELDGIRDCVDVEDAENAGIKAKYEQIKSYMQTFKQSSNRDAVDGYITSNLKANYTKALRLFEE